MKSITLPLMAGIALVSLASVNSQVVVFTEDFNSASAQFPISFHPMERWGSYPLSENVVVPGWNVTGSGSEIFVAPQLDDPSNRAIWLNEPGDPSISRTITGLTPNVEHTLSWEHWGDNVGGTYVFQVTVNGATTVYSRTFPGGTTGSFATETLTFTPTGTSTLLTFADIGPTTASELIDNVRITAAVPEPTSVAVIAAFGLLLFGMVRKGRGRG